MNQNLLCCSQKYPSNITDTHTHTVWRRYLPPPSVAPFVARQLKTQNHPGDCGREREWGEKKVKTGKNGKQQVLETEDTVLVQVPSWQGHGIGSPRVRYS